MLAIFLAYLPLSLIPFWHEKVPGAVAGAVGLLVFNALILYSAATEPYSQFHGTGGLLRVAGMYSSPLVVAPICAVSILWAVALASAQDKGKGSRLLAYFLWALSSLCLYLSYTRAAHIAVCAGLIATVWMRPRPIAVFALVASIGFAVIVFAVRSEAAFGMSRFALDGSITSRTGSMLEGLHLLWSNPLGVGSEALVTSQNGIASNIMLPHVRAYYLNYALAYGVGWGVLGITKDVILAASQYRRRVEGGLSLSVAFIVYKVIDAPFDFNPFTLPASFVFVVAILTFWREKL
jgi:O-Antigen ligase